MSEKTASTYPEAVLYYNHFHSNLKLYQNILHTHSSTIPDTDIQECVPLASTEQFRSPFAHFNRFANINSNDSRQDVRSAPVLKCLIISTKLSEYFLDVKNSCAFWRSILEIFTGFSWFDILLLKRTNKITDVSN